VNDTRRVMDGGNLLRAINSTPKSEGCKLFEEVGSGTGVPPVNHAQDAHATSLAKISNQDRVARQHAAGAG
jgi:hypothetical protein